MATLEDEDEADRIPKMRISGLFPELSPGVRSLELVDLRLGVDGILESAVALVVGASSCTSSFGARLVDSEEVRPIFPKRRRRLPPP